MEEKAEYDFASFDLETDLSWREGSSLSSGVFHCVSHRSHFSVAQLMDLLSTSSRAASTHSKASANTRPRNGEPITASAATTAIPEASILRSPPASVLSMGRVEPDDSVLRMGRYALAPETRSPFSSVAALSSVLSPRSMATVGTGDSVQSSSLASSERSAYIMHALNPSAHKAPENQNRGATQQQQKQLHRKAEAEFTPRLPDAPPHSPTFRQHRSNAPTKMSHMSPQQLGSGTVGHARLHTRDAKSDATTPQAGSPAAAKASLVAGLPTDAAAAATSSQSGINALCNTQAGGSSSAHFEKDMAAQQEAFRDGNRSCAGLGGSAATTNFYDITQITYLNGATLKGEPVVPVNPNTRVATLRWDDESDNDSTRPALACMSNAVEEADADEEHHVQIIIVKASSEKEPVEVRPPPLDARRTYVSTPLLCPLAPPPSSSLVGSSQSARRSANSSNAHTDLRGNFTADEVVDVDYASGGAVHNSLIADSLRIHFLSGHNSMLTIANTPQCTALAEDSVSTMVQSVYRQSELMGSDFKNELSISAHVIYPEGSVKNLLPTTADPQKTGIQVGFNPVMGTCIVNHAPVHMCSMDEATFLSRALIQNARHLRADPYTNPNTLVHVTVLLRQTCASHRSEPDLALPTAAPRSARSPHSVGAVSAAMSTLDMHVHLSSLQILWVGANYPVMRRLLSDQPDTLWQLYRQAFGGRCCTAVMSFVDRKDDLADSKSTLEFSQYMHAFLNRPPLSGSVRGFLLSTEQAASEELDRGIMSLERMRRDAVKLLKDPMAEPCMYAVIQHNELHQQPYIGAYRVVLVPLRAPIPAKKGSSDRNSGERSRRRSVSSASSVAEIRICMPSFIKRQERKVSPQLVSQTQRCPSAPAATADSLVANASSTSFPRQPSIYQSSVTTFSMPSKDACIRSDHRRDQSPSLDPPSPDGLQQQQQHAINGTSHRRSSSSHMDEPPSTASSYGECIKTNVLVVPGTLKSPEYASSSPHLPLNIMNPRTLLLPAPTTSSGYDSRRSEACQFEVDEVREAKYDRSTNTYRLLRNFEALLEIQRAFVEDEANVALLCTHCSAAVPPFQHLPLWEVVESTLMAVSDAQMNLSTPSQLTLFGSILRGNTVVRDLAEVGSRAADRTVDGQEALVGASPLFGPILYQTRGVDLCEVSEIQPVLQSMLRYADDAVGADAGVFLVLMAVRKTTRELPPAEAPGHLPEYTWDASFSSCTVIVTRNSMDLYTNAVAEINAVEGPHRPVFPFGLLSEAIGGSCKSVHFLSIETASATRTLAASMLEAQQKLGQVQNEARRSNRVSVYVNTCLTASRAIHTVLGNLKELAAEGSEVARDITPQDESVARSQATKLEALAEQHAEYLRSANIRGFVIYLTLTVEDMQALFFNSFRYGTNSSGSLRRLQTLHASSATGITRQKTVTSSKHQTEQQQPSLQAVREMMTVSPTDSLQASAKSAAPGGATAAAEAQPASAGALSRDSGIVAHTLLLLLNSSPDGNDKSDSSRSLCHLTTSPTNEVTVNYGGTASVYAFDNVVPLTLEDAATRVSPTRNYDALNASTLLHDAEAGCLAGYNATMVFQETLHAQEKGVCESLCQHVCRSSVASCPPEAAFFMSVAYLDDRSAVDLLDAKAVRAAVRNPGVAGRSEPLVGKSPLTGTFLANAGLKLVCTSRNVSEYLTEAFHGDDAIRAAGAPPHFLVISLWQKLCISAEQDICLSSLLFLLTRGGPRILQTSLTRFPGSAISQLLNYALCGPCYTLCGCGVTDAEPQAATSHDPLDADFEPAMDFFQNCLSAYTGKALRYNSVSDALKSHRKELARVSERVRTYKRKARAAGGREKLMGPERKDGDAAVFAMRHLQRMIEDEEGLLKERMDALHRVPPFYVVKVAH
ncbi:hypothetical protein ABL78_5401 [Leptomonas seymouri]|uniref:Uncharacterized protein n=1 Tax=Leptomonas seymouri TaxID=5684 RepID=A0A0N1PDI9_LEPSE|nr:hypothetical protein ABL78_5401 [Leptomonas seymouri]|eukprot:KPI85520.1 hypothetical protein ABL78_5401 [Leptomonas seymouri]